MKKPYHSPEAFRRLIQMSSTRVFVFVEGQDTDAFFFGEVCRPICESLGISYELVRADRISASGGKEALIRCYELLNTAGSLVERSRATPAISMFFLDKDIDDVLCKQVESAHVVYTPFYNVENVLFVHGDVVRAAAAASSFDSARLQRRIPDSATWRRASAQRWIDFVVFCLFAHKHRLPFDCTYRRNVSPLNDPADSIPTPEVIRQKKDELRGCSGFSEAVFARKFGATRRLVERIYNAGKHDLIFNGKWYRNLLEREIEVVAGDEPYNSFGVANGILAALRANLDFGGAWAEHYRAPLRALIDSV